MLTRRDLLAVGLAASGTALLSACGSDSDPDSTTESVPGGDEAIRRDVAAAELALIHRYDAAIDTAPDTLVPLLTRIRDEHVDHLTSMGGSSTAATPTHSPKPVETLKAAERTAARMRRTAAVAAEDGELARLLALIAASEAGHVAALHEVGA